MTTRGKSPRRAAAAKAKKVGGTLTTPTRRKIHATVLRTVNAPGSKRRNNTGRMAHLKTVNAPGSKRRSTGGSSVHAINAPRAKR